MFARTSLIIPPLVSLLFSTPSFALDFSYDNYSNVPQLKYSYAFPGKGWQTSDILAPNEYKTLKFDQATPSAWKIDVADGSKLQCVDYYTKKPSNNIIFFKKSDFAKVDGLLLDVLAPNSKNAINEFWAYIITTDGSGFNYYSNVIDCHTETIS